MRLRSPGSIPPANRAEMDTPATAPMAMSTMLGGIVSDIAQEAAIRAAICPGSLPRFFISGMRIGATAAMSAILEPEMPETRKIAPNSTYSRPPRTCPSRAARKLTMLRAIPVTSINRPRKMNNGTASNNRLDMPTSIRLSTIVSGAWVEKNR